MQSTPSLGERIPLGSVFLKFVLLCVHGIPFYLASYPPMILSEPGHKDIYIFL